jgi:hypothetical protein
MRVCVDVALALKLLKSCVFLFMKILVDFTNVLFLVEYDTVLI